MHSILNFVLPLVISLATTIVSAEVTVYYPDGEAPLETSAAGGFSGYNAYNPIVLDPPPVPSPAPSTSFPIRLHNSPSDLKLSIPQPGSFLGFSLEFYVASQISTYRLFLINNRTSFSLSVGKNGTVLQIPFLNLMSNIQQRAGSVNIRIGGSSVDYSSITDNLDTSTIAILYGSAYPVRLYPVFFHNNSDTSSS